MIIRRIITRSEVFADWITACLGLLWAGLTWLGGPTWWAVTYNALIPLFLIVHWFRLWKTRPDGRNVE